MGKTLFVSGLEVQTRRKAHNFYNNFIRPHNLEGHRHPTQRVDYLQSLSAWSYSLQNLAKVRAQLLCEINEEEMGVWGLE
jgi:hypothetical protein